MLVLCAKNQWQAGTLDVKTAFLNAVINHESSTNLIIVKPPALLVERGYLPPDIFYIPERAVYGLRRSPKLWGECRDEVLEEIQIEVKKKGGNLKLKLIPMESEPNLWMIHEKSDLSGEALPCLRGLLMTYADDMMIAGEESVVTSVMAVLQSKWTTSTPDRVSATPIHFLGTEITKHEVQGRDIWLLSQESYVRDLIAQGGEEIKPRKIPITRDQSVLLEELEEGITPEKVKRAQKEMGELLWLVTRSRSELMFTVSKMGSATTKAPDQVHEVYKQAMGYLLSHPSDGLVFDVKSEDPWLLEAFANSSFSPQGKESHGAFLIKLCGCPVFWRSGRQPLISLSTAESEMMEAVESLVAGESVGVIAEELQGDLLKIA
eukprot:s11_g3.t1